MNDLMYGTLEVQKALVIAPKRVAEDTWSREAAKWDHLNHLRISKIIGTAKARKAAAIRDADVYIVSRDNVKWLVDLFGDHWPYDMLIIDELSSFKSPSSQRFKALRKVMPMVDRVVGLTGTPAPNGYMDLWSEIYLLDQGKRLGRTIGAYREKYFRPGFMNGYTVYSWEIKCGSREKIDSLLSDLCVSMTAADYLNMPDRIDNFIRIRMDAKETALYKNLERESMIEMDGEYLGATSAAGVANKLHQLANGFLYREGEEPMRIHERKLDALEELLEGQPVLVFYSFKEDLAMLQKRFPKARILQTSRDIADWNDGKIQMLLAHPASVGHGLNLQDGGHICVWYGLTWSLELYQQANARLYRQGQKHTVIIHHLITEGTIDEDVMHAIEDKAVRQDRLIEALKERKDATTKKRA